MVRRETCRDIGKLVADRPGYLSLIPFPAHKESMTMNLLRTISTLDRENRTMPECNLINDSIFCFDFL
jgi:hypothetical protein